MKPIHHLTTGSTAWLGYTAFGESTLEELWPGYWLPATSCD